MPACADGRYDDRFSKMNAASMASPSKSSEHLSAPSRPTPSRDPLAALDALTFATFEVVRTYIERQTISASEVANFIVTTHAALSSISPTTPDAPSDDADVSDSLVRNVGTHAALDVKRPPVEQTVFEDYLICLEDGKRFKSLTRHLRKLGLTPDAYRRKWSLPSDYPMEAPGLAARRVEVAANFAKSRSLSTNVTRKKG